MNSNKTQIPFHGGMNFGFKAPRGYFSSPEGQAQPERMAALNINGVALIVSVYMDTYASTTVYSDFVETPSDDEVRLIIERFHQAGIRVMLKPFLVLKDSTWQGGFTPPVAREEITAGVVIPYRELWTASFRAMLAHYADLARECGVESLCLGNEYHGLEGFNDEWRSIVAAVRERYAGLLTSDFVQHSLDARKIDPAVGDWWRELDFLGMSFYPPFPKADASTEEIVASLQPRVRELRELCAGFDKPLVFSECGMRSTSYDTAGAHGYHSRGTYDGHIQGRFLEAIFAAFRPEPWWRGLVWWKWDEHQNRPNFHIDPAGPQTFTVDGKPSGEVMRRLYGTL
jgi:hypothetical protein